MGDLDEIIKTEFDTKCVGKAECEIEFNYQTMFNDRCIQEIERRQKGKTFYGPAKVIGLARCEQDYIEVNESWNITRESAAQLIVLLDAVIVIIFVMAVFRLRWYEGLFEKDR